MFLQEEQSFVTPRARKTLFARRRGIALILSVIVVLGVSGCLGLLAQEMPIRLVENSNVVEIQAYAPNIVGIHVEPDGKVTPRTLVMDPSLKPAGGNAVQVERSGAVQTLSSPEMKVVINNSPFFSVQVEDAQGKTLVTLKSNIQTGPGMGSFPGGGPPAGRGPRPAFLPTVLIHNPNEKLYGITALPWHDDIHGGILRTNGGTVAASFQGDGGGPFFFTKQYGVLVDSDGGNFSAIDQNISFRGSRPDTEYFIIVGPPLKTMAGLATLTGRPPMPPKWSLGFMNSQWGSTEQEWKQITQKYEEEGIPVSAYILDFDWKAWGEDDYGEWRWNSTSGPGNVSPNKFPDGASGKFAADMLSRGIHLVGIMKPRILVNQPDGQMTQAAAYATEHHFWYPNEANRMDYFSHRLANDINFADPAARKWFWDHMEPAFHAGIAGWWNDEADQNGDILFNNLQFMNMVRAEYDGQRSVSNQRFWSINRNYYLGAARYGYAEWSGDITTGFQSMAYQRRRMIATLNLGESEWSMDTGGFIGHPSPENYARWVEFAAFVPIFRVHGSFNQKRQPWVYGPKAEAAAKKAILLRYDLLPYIYSYAHEDSETGIGLVRPLLWEFPGDPQCSTETDAWMFGDALLVSPIVAQDSTSHEFYLPPGTWFDYFSGKQVEGGRVVSVTPNSTDWQDIPVYVRDGSIVATQPDRRGDQLSPASPLVLNIFPSSKRVASFSAYDDDGLTYNYEKGDSFQQEITATRLASATNIKFDTAAGTYQPHFTSYLLRVRQVSHGVRRDGQPLRKFASASAFQSSSESGWFSTTDRFGPVTEIRLPIDAKQHTLALALH